MDPHAERTGLAHVATVSFVAARIAPTAAFWISLSGGIALARASARHGMRAGYGASLAAMLQSVAILGPARISGPLTQALSAPLLGAMHARGRGLGRQMIACASIRFAHYMLLTGVAVVLVGPDAYVGTYDRLLGWLLPEGAVAAVVATGLNNLFWAIVYSAVQVVMYREGQRHWPDGVAAAPAPPPVAEAPPAGRFDPRAVVLAAAVVLVCALATIRWPVLVAAAAWLAIVAAVTRGRDADVVRIGLILALALALGAASASLIAGFGVDVAARRGLRAALVVLVATWVRAAAGAAGLREVFRRTLSRLHRLPGAQEARESLAELDSGARLSAAARELAGSVQGVPRRPRPLAAALLRWTAAESRAHGQGAPLAHPALTARVRDVVLVVVAAAPGLAVVVG
jgi:hypothetical protein